MRSVLFKAGRKPVTGKVRGGSLDAADNSTRLFFLRIAGTERQRLNRGIRTAGSSCRYIRRSRRAVLSRLLSHAHHPGMAVASTAWVALPLS